MIRHDTQLYTLSPEMTAFSLAGRVVFRILCCGRKMQQIYVQSHLPSEDRIIGLSQTMLRCPECQHIIQLESLTNRFIKRDVIYSYLDSPILTEG